MGRGTEDWLGAMRSVAPYHEAGVLVEDGFFGHAAVTLRPRSLTFRGQKDSSRSRSERRLEWGRVCVSPARPSCAGLGVQEPYPQEKVRRACERAFSPPAFRARKL